MRNKLRVIDVSMLSSYMGKALTVFVTLFVVGIAVSALVDSGGFERNVVRVCVRAGARSGDALEDFEPFRSLLGRETHRPVTLSECSGDWPRGLDVYVMPVDEFFRWEGALQIVPVFEVSSSETPGDKAVVVSRASEAPLEVSSLRLEDVVFVHPGSVNGFWVQADAVAEEEATRSAERHAGGGGGGTERPADRVIATGSLRFEGATNDATRVVCGVAVGAFRFGACTMSDVIDLSRRGVVAARELRVVLSRDRLPETVVAVDRHEARYFERKLGRIAALLGRKPPAGDESDAVRLLRAAGVRRLERLEAERIGAVRRLYERFGGVEPAGRVAPEGI